MNSGKNGRNGTHSRTSKKSFLPTSNRRSRDRKKPSNDANVTGGPGSAGGWDEIKKLYDKALFWFFLRGNSVAAKRHSRRLPRLLEAADPAQEAIFTHSCLAIVKEIEGDLPGAITHRETEIRLIKQLHRISLNTPGREYVLESYGYSDLSDRLDLLAGLYHDSGALDIALRVLRQSQRLCKSKNIPFDGADMLDEYLAEKRSMKRLKTSA